jgi:hypothetical protein
MADMMHTPRATAFSIAFQPNRGAPKPKAKKGPFPFLQRNQGHLACDVAATSPRQDEQEAMEPGRAVDSRSLREAIAQDMRKARHHDPFETAAVAVPKRAPPPNRVDQQQQQDGAGGAKTKKEQPVRDDPRSAATRKQEDAPRRRPEWDGSAASGGQAELDDSAEQQRLQSGKREQPPSRPQRTKREPTSILDDEYVDPPDEHDSDSREREQLSKPPSRGGRGGVGDDQAKAPAGAGGRHDDWRRHGDEEAQDPRGDRGYRTAQHERRTPPQHQYHPPSSGRRRLDELEDSDELDAPPAQSNLRTNFFGKGRDRRHRGDPSMAETELVEQLEEELQQARAERQELAALKSKLERDRQRFNDAKAKEEQRLQHDREDLEAHAEEERRASRREAKALEERNKQLSKDLHSEKDNSRRIQAENDALRDQLERVAAQLREAQRQHKVEVERLRSDLASLTNRNAELLDMAREHQANDLAARHQATRGQQQQQPSAAYRSEISGGNRRDTVSHTSSANSDIQFEEDQDDERGRGGSSAADMEDEVPADDYHDRQRLQRERRALEIEQRLRAEEEERQQRKAQKERERIAQKQRDDEAARQREEARLREEERLAKLKEERRQAESAKRAAEEDRKRRQEELEKQRMERRSAGHPPNTPRSGQQQPASNAQQQPSAPSQPNPSLPPGLPPAGKPRGEAGPSQGNRRRIPTAEELVNDTEPMPEEEVPNDAVVSMPPAGDASNKREILYRSGKRETHYSNGTRKVVLRSGHVVLYFTNGDVKRSFPSGKSTYWYAVAQTLHTQMPDGVQVFQFESSGQTERHRPDGTKEILYPDGIFKTIREDGRQETIFPDGTVQVS